MDYQMYVTTLFSILKPVPSCRSTTKKTGIFFQLETFLGGRKWPRSSSWQWYLSLAAVLVAVTKLWKETSKGITILQIRRAPAMQSSEKERGDYPQIYRLGVIYSSVPRSLSRKGLPKKRVKRMPNLQSLKHMQPKLHARGWRRFCVLGQVHFEKGSTPNATPIQLEKLTSIFHFEG